MEFVGKDARGEGQLLFEAADLSAGGTFLKSDLLLETGEALTVEFHVPGVPRTLSAQAKVAWVRRFPAENEQAGMGVAFLAMREEDRDLLDDYLRSLEAMNDS